MTHASYAISSMATYLTGHHVAELQRGSSLVEPHGANEARHRPGMEGFGTIDSEEVNGFLINS